MTEAGKAMVCAIPKISKLTVEVIEFDERIRSSVNHRYHGSFNGLTLAGPLAFARED